MLAISIRQYAVVATCAVAGSFKGADIMNGETDDQLMTRAFIDHLENAPNEQGVYYMQNPKSQSSGIIKTTGFYLKDILSNVLWLKQHMIKI